MSNKSTEQNGVSEYLYELTEEQIQTLDREATDGAGWNLYCQSYISHPSVFKNKISGRFRSIEMDYFVEVEVGRSQITTFCSTCRSGVICTHSVALLFSWVYDQEAFFDVAESVRELEGLDKQQLIEIITRIISKNADTIQYVRGGKEEEDDYDLDGLMN